MLKLHDHLGFTVRRTDVRNGIYIPKYYNPEITQELSRLQGSHELNSLGELIQKRFVQVSTGDEIGKMAYGTGSIPFVRTSDISNWEIKADPKQGVSEEIYRQYKQHQDVREGDILFVRDGTYLIGGCCMVTASDAKILYQSHLLKFRVSPDSVVSNYLLLALLSSPIVQKQVRAKQFTADIIDTIGSRFMELVLPIPKDRVVIRKIEQRVKHVISERVRLRELLRRVPFWVQGQINGLNEELPEASDKMFEDPENIGFIIARSQLRSNILVPRYYNPEIDVTLSDLKRSASLVSIAELESQGVISLSTGVEIGKMAYGTGNIPFVRTSDISNWELKSDSKQNVSKEIYERYSGGLDVQAGDIFVVRDGTYLVGTSCILTTHDTKILYCGGLYKIRVNRADELDPYLLLALLNCPIVRQQMRAKQFTRDVIDTLGKRIYEIFLPVPKSKRTCQAISDATRQIVETRASLRNDWTQIAQMACGSEVGPDEDIPN